MTLHLHRAERTDLLVAGLTDLLRQPLADPFATEVVVVPARGVERWVTQRLSHHLGTGPGRHDGVCAGVRFVTPWSLVHQLLGPEGDDPWEPDALTWPVLQVMDAVLDEPWASTLARHLGHGLTGEEADLRRDRRWSVARRVAGLLASYAVQRPAVLDDWLQPERPESWGDGVGGVLSDDLAWQPELARRVAELVSGPTPGERLSQARTALAAGRWSDGRPLDLPARVSLFGHTRIAGPELDLLTAVAEHREVHLWLPQPSAALWDALSELSRTGPVPRVLDDSAARVRHPLLASLGRDSRELQRTLAPAHPGTDTLLLPEEPLEPRTLLGWLQADLRSNRAPDATLKAARRVDPALDRSVQVHAAHGAARQVDVLREVVVGLLADDPTLEPRDILVMCPDVETFAPLVAAGFSLAEIGDQAGKHPGHQVRVRMADRSLTAVNPMLELAATLVHLVGGRMTSVDLLDLASHEAVRRRFGFTDDDLERLAGWIEEAGVRWGLDGTQRATFGLELTDNTWRRGLDRILLGVAMADDGSTLGHTLPVDDVGSGDVALAGRLAEYVDRLTTFLHATQRASTATEWLQALSAAVLGVAAPPRDGVWQQAQFERELARVGAAAGAGTSLRLADLRALLTHRLGGRPTRSNFRTGTLTVCTMVPMRSVPHRVVCLVGLDDGVFPRTGAPDGDDVLAATPCTGERDPRSEDRQLFLDAVLATTETLVITYTGAGEHTGEARPPAVPVGELLDALDATATATTGEPVSAHVRVAHPLQPFDARNLTVGALQPERLFSFDPASLRGAEAARRPRLQVGPIVSEPLPPEPVADVELADLRDFFTHPVRHFLRRRLALASVQTAEEVALGIPIELTGLERYQIGERLLRSLQAGVPPWVAGPAEDHRGHLPPGLLGERTAAPIRDAVLALDTGSKRFHNGPARTLDIDIALDPSLGSGRRLTGTVTDVFGNNRVTVSYASLAAKHRLAAWIDLLALRLGHEDESWVSHAIGRFGRNQRHAQSGPLDEQAAGWLTTLVELYDRGRREPLPLPLKTSLAWAEENARARRGAEADPIEKARGEWVTDPFNEFAFAKEQDDAWHVRAFGRSAPLEVLLGPPRVDEQFNDEPTRLGQYARALWEPLLANERTGGL